MLNISEIINKYKTDVRRGNLQTSSWKGTRTKMTERASCLFADQKWPKMEYLMRQLFDRNSASHTHTPHILAIQTCHRSLFIIKIKYSQPNISI